MISVANYEQQKSISQNKNLNNKKKLTQIKIDNAKYNVDRDINNDNAKYNTRIT